MLKRTILTIAACLLIVTASVSVIGATPVNGGTLKIAATSMQQLDPYKTAANDETNLCGLVFDPLVIISKDNFMPIPHLAEKWETPDDLTWIFRIHKGVYFQEGNDIFKKGAKREVTADDVVYSINRFLKVSTKFTLGDIKSVKALDRYTVEIKTPTPSPFLVADSNRLASVGIVPHEAIEKLGEDGFAKRPIGSGPFQLKSFSPDQGAVLERNPNYWLPVHIDKVEFVVIPDPTVQIMALTAGEVDVVPYLFNIDAMATVAKNPKLETMGRGGSYRGLGFNVTKPPFNELAVRDAISKAMDIDAAFKAVVAPHGERAYGQCAPWLPHGYDPTLKSLWKYDPKEALAILQKAGFRDTNGDGILDRNGQPLKVEIRTIPGSQVRVLTILATQLKQIGIDASVMQQDSAVWVSDIVDGNAGVFFDFSFAGTTGLHSLFHSSSIGRTNGHFYSNATVDSLLDRALATTDINKITSLWKQAQRQIMMDRASIPLYFEWGYSIVNKKVNDFVPPWGGLHLVSMENNVWISK
ncbi:MAG: ABC transporter substrate-binding protein [Clostridia bacterium]|nr:ABC transporter substrate-binding protein [Clostridia bacterium]